MGLDMYVYAINKEVVEGQPEIGISVHELARKAVGFIHKSEAELKLLGEKDQKAYFEQHCAATDKAVKLGIFDKDFDYWRKFNALHGWMEKLYEAKGGTGSFNCEAVRLNPEDLDALELAVKKDQLVPTAGFFFGSQDPFDADDAEEVNSFIAKAREAISNGKAIWYDSWW
jgi:hypothetical protein